MADTPLILVVDDEAAFREIFKTKLTASGFRVETAENGQEGVDKAKQLKPALILMDVRMPVLDGAAAVLKLHADPETKDIKVAFLTSLGDPRAEMRENDRKFAEDFGGGAQYFEKTEDLDMLMQKVRAIVEPNSAPPPTA
jgi:CheY-like chemotaxis protein